MHVPQDSMWQGILKIFGFWVGTKRGLYMCVFEIPASKRERERDFAQWSLSPSWVLSSRCMWHAVEYCDCCQSVGSQCTFMFSSPPSSVLRPPSIDKLAILVDRTCRALIPAAPVEFIHIHILLLVSPVRVQGDSIVFCENSVTWERINSRFRIISDDAR